ncbi:MAG TPA: ferredoxin-thioredoxin reductase catalytic domain-containing protein [Candidatus Deferrimicrobium sp.]|nr:ferredoxin-thioredoxin reductase catalytic domain-containing protein [Candidatus Deferrimicrobium sp.]
MPDLEKTRKYVKMVSEHRGWPLQPDEKWLNGLIEGLATNLDRFGYRSCPCRLASGDKEQDKDIICPCQYAEPDIAEYGHCYCSLFWSKEFLASGKPHRNIPERRPIDKME